MDCESLHQSVIVSSRPMHDVSSSPNSKLLFYLTCFVCVVCRRSIVLDHLMEMARVSRSSSALKCISYCFYHLQICLSGLKLAVTRGPDLKSCFNSIQERFISFDALSLVSCDSDSSQTRDGLILISKCLEMLDQADARLSLFDDSWTVPVASTDLYCHSTTCGICMEDLTSSDIREIRAVCCPGRHIFHAECILDFFVYFGISSFQDCICCPYCRFKLLNT